MWVPAGQLPPPRLLWMIARRQLSGGRTYLGASAPRATAASSCCLLVCVRAAGDGIEIKPPCPPGIGL